MKKIIILLSVLAFLSCSLLPNNGGKDVESINKAIETAKDKITDHTNTEIERAKKEIGNAVASVVSKADSTLTRQFTAVAQSLNTEAEKTKKELNGKISGIEDNITKAKAISFIGIAIGILGIILAILAYRKRPRTNVNRVRDLIAEEIDRNDLIRNKIRGIAGAQGSSYRPQASAPSQATIDRSIEVYMTSKRFRDMLQQCVSSSLVQSRNVPGTTRTEHTMNVVAKPLYQIFAKESTSMLLSNIQDTYQKGKSIYKLTMPEPNASTAEVSICIDQEEVKQRVLKFDSQYLEPICTVTRSSNEPTQVVINATGLAERIGEEWKVVRPVIVEIK